ncbi:hypothetical protein [Prosthecomicrobium sp. N25]|uniref:hypothetical protein n=1 Tax=Prosthecomicrobium sp. N25 TaxID=3129254 RepID=UPI00307794BA
MNIKVGFPHDPVKRAQAQERRLNDLLQRSVTAWQGYFGTLSLAYFGAHAMHLNTLKNIEALRNQNRFLVTVILGTILPAMAGGVMATIVSNSGRQVSERLLALAQKRDAALNDIIYGGFSTTAEDLTKNAVTGALQGLQPAYGDEWKNAGEDPAKFFVQLNTMVNNYATDAYYAVDLARRTNDLDKYRDTVNSYFLNPFIVNAPLDRDRLYTEAQLQPVFEILLWIMWARTRPINYWRTNIGIATSSYDRSLIGAVWDGLTKDEDALARVMAKDAVVELDPILKRLVACGIPESEVTMQAGWDRRRRILNILWVRILGSKHRNTVLGDLADALDAAPTLAFDSGPVTKARRLL